MTVIARRVASTPTRTTGETWSLIVDLLAPQQGEARNELGRASGVISMLIADEVTKDLPIVVSGNGPQIRIYTVHGPDAIDGAGVSEGSLVVTPTEESWTMSVPVPPEDIVWVRGELAGLPHISISDPVVPARPAAQKSSHQIPVVDLKELRS